MRYYFAPMEGLTDSIYRREHHRFFGGVDRYYMPFFSPTVHRTFTSREARELPKADSVPFCAVPQVLTNDPENFLWAAEACRDLDGLSDFFDRIFAKSPLPVSVKTRLGMEEPEEFEKILALYNRYPIRELIVHPRVRRQFYDGQVHSEWFAYAAQNSRNPLCYNGDIRSLADIRALEEAYPQLLAVMVGRGLIADPGMLAGGTEIDTLEAFLNALMDDYTEEFSGCRNALFRMKENWAYLHNRFAGSDKLWKQMRKTTDAAQFRALSAQVLHTYPLV